MVRVVRAVLGAALALVASCAGAQGEHETTAREETASLDEAARLAMLLPSSADRCSVARPSLVADRRRPLILHASQGDVLAWSRDLRIVAYASARRLDERGRAQSVTLLSLAGGQGERRDELEASLPLRVRWEGEPCRADQCDLPRASMLDARTLRIERGAPSDARAGDSPCVDLAIAWPSAVELDVSRQDCEDTRSEGCTQRRILEPTDDGLRQRVEDSLGSERAAMRALESLRLVPGLEGGIDVDRRGATVVTLRSISWAELELLLEDERIERAAYRRRDEARRTRALDEVDVESLPLVRQQVQLREERLARLHGEGRRRAAEELAALLSAATMRHLATRPEDALDLARRLVRVQLDELDDPAGASQTIDAALATGVAPRETWRGLRREARIASLARALASPDETSALTDAASALREDGLAPDDTTARAAALDLAVLRAAGATHELAESAWTHARAVTRRAISLRAMPSGAGVPIAALPATLAWLAELGGDPGPFSVFVVARATLAEGTRAVTGHDAPDEARVLRFEHLADRATLAGSGASIDALLHLGASIESALAPGPITIDVVLTSISTPSVERTLRFEGELGVGRVRIERGDAWIARHDWPAIERYLADPLRAMGARLFPPPELVVRATSEEEAAHLARIGDDPPQARCAAEGIEVRCVPRPDSDARGALRRIVRASLGAGLAPASE
ncbi:hypothetical protein [Sandaracinus amylolyticus]|uniref:hypothetical protein n=1 Tax=Sandaracinus amylolyticus TaxID=927083 RepID=UPI001F2A0067|nr:hypothetical protein [Sandaracinus amylolyticus]UJR80855.1 Hypothetical protein I5071_29050 [Sandaracinus amylolyticus]